MVGGAPVHKDGGAIAEIAQHHPGDLENMRILRHSGARVTAPMIPTLI
jgi:hypothetical protein